MEKENKKPENPSAFPTKAIQDKKCPARNKLEASQGMSLRDYFAAKALQSLMIGEKFFDYTPPMRVSEAYNYADKMLEQREVNND